MFDAECNTYIKMKDLDILMSMKSQANHTIATLEKAYDKYSYLPASSAMPISRHTVRNFK